MTDEEIRQLAEKTKKEKYCCKFRFDELDCGDCPITYEGYPCSEDYVLSFVEGFKAAMSICEQKLKIADTMLNASKQLTNDANKIKYGTFVKNI